MGTNFYYKIPISKKRQKELKEMITEDPSLSEICDAIYDIKENNVIHLGKRSAGWQFLWDFNNGKFFASNLKSIEHFLNTGGGYIEDEYGERFTTDQFFKDEIVDCLYKDERHCDIAGYQKQHPEEGHYYTPINEEFISDGLRFSRHTDFC
jgi:hypothetical protein